VQLSQNWNRLPVTLYKAVASGKRQKTKFHIPIPKGKKPPTGKKALGVDNFDVLELRSITINEIPYSVLIVKYMSGIYRFPNSEEGWKTFEVLDYYIFKPSKLAELSMIRMTFPNLGLLHSILYVPVLSKIIIQKMLMASSKTAHLKLLIPIR